MQLFIANGTYAHYEFQFRLPNLPKILKVDIAPGGQQEVLPQGMTQTQINAAIKQLERYGALPANEATRLISPRALIYWVNEPIDSEMINAAREKDEEIRQDIADSKIIESGTALLGVTEKLVPQVGRKMQSSSLKIEQMENDHAAKGGVDTVIKVDRKAPGGRREKNK